MIEAYSRAIERLERSTLPEVRSAEAEAARRNALAAAQAMYEERLECAREIVRLGSKLDQQWKAFRGNEDAYNALIYQAGLEPRDLNNAAIVGAVNSVVPSLVGALSTVYGTPVLGGENPVALVKANAPDRLRRQR
jgi:hypothetical protein